MGVFVMDKEHKEDILIIVLLIIVLSFCFYIGFYAGFTFLFHE
jgi:hypothetical protein